MTDDICEVLAKHEYEFVRYLNGGSFGSCYIVHSLRYNMDFVCKVSTHLNLCEKYLSSFRREAEILTKLNHPNIVRIYDFFFDNSQLFLILEYCSNGSLLDMIYTKKKLEIPHLIKIAKEIVDAMAFMHSKGIAHCDIKLSNILIDQFNRVKICDFGLSQFLKAKPEENQHNTNRVIGIINYMAPEILLGMEYDAYKSDVWAVGVTLYSLLMGRFPFVGTTMQAIMKEIQIGNLGLNHIEDPIVRIIESMLQLEPSDRPSFKELVITLNDSCSGLASKRTSNSKVFTGVAQHSIIKSRRLSRITRSSVF